MVKVSAMKRERVVSIPRKQQNAKKTAPEEAVISRTECRGLLGRSLAFSWADKQICAVGTDLRAFDRWNTAAHWLRKQSVVIIINAL